MRMVYKDDVLYVDIEGNIGIIELNIIKSRLFCVLDQYEVDEIVINTSNVFNLNRKNMTFFAEEYHAKYHGKLLINY